MAGTVTPVIEKPGPDRSTELTVTGAVPEDVSVMDCVAVEFRATEPKSRLDALTVNCAVTAAAPCPVNEAEASG